MNESDFNLFCREISSVENDTFFSRNKKEFKDVLKASEDLKANYSIGFKTMSYMDRRRLITDSKENFTKACKEYINKNTRPLTKQDKKRIELIKKISVPKKPKFKSGLYQYHSLGKMWLKDKSTWEKIKEKFSGQKKKSTPYRKPVNIDGPAKKTSPIQKSDLKSTVKEFNPTK